MSRMSNGETVGGRCAANSREIRAGGRGVVTVHGIIPTRLPPVMIVSLRP
jgi:hypothetical protein